MPRQTMTAVRACQVARQLLRRLETHALTPGSEKPICMVNEEELDAMRTLIAVTAKAACGFTTPAERRDGTLHIPKD